MNKILLFIILIFISVSVFSQHGEGDYIKKIKTEKIKSFGYVEADSGIIFLLDTIRKTTQLNSQDDTLVTKRFMYQETDSVLFSSYSDTSKVSLRTSPVSNVLVVDQGGNWDFTTIQAAIDSANTQFGTWQIQINEGTYNEQIILYDSIQLVGVDDDMVIITSASPVITFASEKSAIRDITIICTTAGEALYANNSSSTSEIKIQNCDINTVCCAFDFTSDGTILYENNNLLMVNTSTLSLSSVIFSIKGDVFLLTNNNGYNLFDNRVSGDIVIFKDSTSNRGLYGNSFFDINMTNASYSDSVFAFKLLGSGAIDIQNTVQSYSCANSDVVFIYTIGGGDIQAEVSGSDLNFDSYSTLSGVITENGDSVNVNMCYINAPFSYDSNGLVNFLINQDGALITNEDIIDDNMRIGDATNKSLNDYFNIQGNAGWVSGGGITVLTDSTVTINTGTGLIRVSNSDQADLKMFDFPDTTNLKIPALNMGYYAYVDYNSGNPIIKITTNSNLILDNEKNLFELYKIVRESDTIHVIQHFQRAINLGGRLQRYFYSIDRIRRSNEYGGLIIGETGTRNITLSGGLLWLKLNSFETPSINTSTGDTFDRYYRDGSGGFTKMTEETQWNNTQYDNGTGTLATVGASKWSYQDYWVDTEGQLVSMFGQAEYTSEALATAAPRIGSLPERIESHGLYVGRIVFQVNAATGTVLSAFTAIIGGSAAITSHNDLSGLNTGNYYHLTPAELSYIQNFKDSVNSVESDPLFDIKFATKTTDDLTEGVTNLYDQIVSFSGGTNITIDGTYPNFTITDNSGTSNLVLGETSITAYRGDRGKIAYDHSQLITGNPHNVLATEITDFHTQVSLNDSVLANSLHRLTDLDKDSLNEIQDLLFNTTNGILSITKGTGYNLDGRYALISDVEFALSNIRDSLAWVADTAQINRDSIEVLSPLVRAFSQSGANYVYANSAFGADNRVLRSDGTGRGSQYSLMTIDDSGSPNIPSGQNYKINDSQISSSNLSDANTLAKWGVRTAGYLLYYNGTNLTNSNINTNGTLTSINTPDLTVELAVKGRIRLYQDADASKGFLAFLDELNASKGFIGIADGFGLTGDDFALRATGGLQFATNGTNLRFSISSAGVASLTNTTDATTGGLGSFTTPGGIYASKKIISGTYVDAVSGLLVNGVNINTIYQPLDADLTAISALNTTGYARRTAINTWELNDNLADSTAVSAIIEDSLTIVRSTISDLESRFEADSTVNSNLDLDNVVQNGNETTDTIIAPQVDVDKFKLNGKVINDISTVNEPYIMLISKSYYDSTMSMYIGDRVLSLPDTTGTFQISLADTSKLKSLTVYGTGTLKIGKTNGSDDVMLTQSVASDTLNIDLSNKLVPPNLYMTITGTVSLKLWYYKIYGINAGIIYNGFIESF